MNEYNGFKVGDKVEIHYPHFCSDYFVGTIRGFGNIRVGGFSEPDELDVIVDDRIFNMFSLYANNLIKRLNKFSSGDLVRAEDGNIYKVDHFSEIENVYYFGDGNPRFHESKLKPFDGFRIGDTVYTKKRGKGKIVYSSVFEGRPWWVSFESDLDHEYTPKIENISAFAFPKQTIQQSQERYPKLVITVNGEIKHKSKFGIDEWVIYAECIRAQVDQIHFDKGKFTYCLRTNDCCSPVPEDALFNYIRNTVFTHWLVSVNGNLQKKPTAMTPGDYEDVKYLGKLFGSTDTFSAINPRTKALTIFFGKKGDDL